MHSPVGKPMIFFEIAPIPIAIKAIINIAFDLLLAISDFTLIQLFIYTTLIVLFCGSSILM